MLVCPYTAQYQKYMERLWSSLPEDCSEGFVPLHYYSGGSWRANTLLKAVYAVERWGVRGYNNLWIIDADMEYTGNGPLDPLWDLLKTDSMAVLWMEDDIAGRKRKYDNQISAGIIGFRDDPIGRAAATHFASACKTFLESDAWTYPEQAALMGAYNASCALGMQPAHIPLPYGARPKEDCPRDGMWDLPRAECIFAHLPASRKEKRRVE